MENQATTIDWWGLIIQWSMLFGVLTVWFLPAFLLRNLAKQYGKVKIGNFFLGLVIGVICWFSSVWVTGIIRENLNGQPISQTEMIFSLFLSQVYWCGFLFIFSKDLFFRYSHKYPNR